jgi:hypothetical protein
MLEKSHLELSRQARYQIEVMCAVMLKAVQSHDIVSQEDLPYLVQNLTIRIDALNDAMAAAFDDVNTETIRDLRTEVRGPGSYAGGAHV